MSASYVRIHSDAAIGANIKNAQPSVTIAQNMKRLVRIKFVATGRLTGLEVRQTGGTNVAFTVDLLTTKAPYPPDTDVPVGDAAAITISTYRVIPQIVGTAGNPASFDDDTFGYLFRNVDGGFTDQQRYLYVLITPIDDVDPTTWDIRLEAECYVQ